MSVYVSDDFDLKLLVRNAIKSGINRDVESLDLYPPLEGVHNSFEER